MAASTEPRSGLSYGWTLGESNWHTGMDANLLKVGRLGVPNLYVLDRHLAAPPGSPAAGDAYIVAAAATGAWAGHEKHIAVWSGSAWVFYTPSNGWAAVVIDEGKLAAYLSGAWSSGVAL
jgi:Protein of unknown function (DUF2793)